MKHGPVGTSLQQIMAARRAYFEMGESPGSVIDEAIYSSWRRCVAAERREYEAVAFEPVGRSRLGELLERNGGLLAAAAGPLEQLAKAVGGAGYVVLLTDSRGNALAVSGSRPLHNEVMRLAFRQGVDLSENAVGTSAMSCAMAERRAVRVVGPEHFFAAIHDFHCSAAPIIDPEGKVIGAVDITRDSPVADPGALSLVSQCAQAIERELFRQLPFYLTMDLSWQGGRQPGQQDLVFAFGNEGQIMAFNENARRFLGLGERHPELHFEDVFEGRFGDCAGRLREAAEPMSIRLRSGLSLFATPGEFRGTSRRGRVQRPPSGLRPAASQPALPEFGDPAIGRQIGTALRALASGLPLMILGETGTGKEVAATALHAGSGRAGGPLVAINCAAIPESLIEGELFGHVDGAFTGARRGGAPGKIEQADGGTLFLDEIGDMPLHLQARLLRVLETREVSRLGAANGRKFDFQLICATHQDIARAIDAGRFRQDLYYRINGFALTLTPLRLRPELPALAQAMLDAIAGSRLRLSAAALDLLAAHAWPGNVRELKHALTYAFAIADSAELLEPAHFPPQLLAAVAAPAKPAGGAGLLNGLEEQAIRRALNEAGGHVPSAAKILGLSRATLYRRLRPACRPQ